MFPISKKKDFYIQSFHVFRMAIRNLSLPKPRTIPISIGLDKRSCKIGSQSIELFFAPNESKGESLSLLGSSPGLLCDSTRLNHDLTFKAFSK